MLQKAGASWPENGIVEEKWKAVSVALTPAVYDVHVVKLIGSVTISLQYSHCLTAGIRLTIGGAGR